MINFGSGLEDQFHFSYDNVTATNFRLTAEVTGLAAGTGGNAVVGVMARAGTANSDDEAGGTYALNTGYGNQNAPNEFGIFYNDLQSGVLYPSSGGVGWVQSGVIGAPITTPFWLELVKFGNNFAVYKSADGLNWTMLANSSGAEYSAPGSVDVGFCVCSGYNSSTSQDNPIATATISNISLNTSPALPFETSWIGDSQQGNITGWTASSVNAMWTDSSGDCFTNFLPFENDNGPYEYTNGKVTAVYSYYWGGQLVYGDGEEGSITGDNNGNIYLWGEGPPNNTQSLFKAPVGVGSLATALGTTSAISRATGMAWDSGNGYLYVSDPSVALPGNNILAINPAQSGSSQEVTAADFAFASNSPGPMTIDGQGRLWIISEGQTPGNGEYTVSGAPLPSQAAAVYSYTPTSTGATMGSIGISGVTDTTPTNQSQAITAASDSSPIVITTSNNHGLATGQTVTIAGVQGNWAANGSWTVTVLTSNTFQLNGSTGNGTYTFGGNVTFASAQSVGWNPTAICYDASTNQLLITDNGPDQNVKIFNLTNWTSGIKSAADSTFGATGGVFSGATPGLMTDASGSSARFFGPVGVGVDSSGNIYVAENYNFAKVVQCGDIRSFTSSGTQNWDAQGLTWVDDGDFDPLTGDVYSTLQHYRMNYGLGSGSEWSEYSFLYDPYQSAVIPGGESEYCSEARRINGTLYLFTDDQPVLGQIDIYRISGEQMVPCGSVSNENSATLGWVFNVWSDSNADALEDGTISGTQTGEVSTFVPVEGGGLNNGFDTFDVDSSGNIWITQQSGAPGASVLELKMLGVTSGVPNYSVASSSDYAYYRVPAPFNYTWTYPYIRYIASTDTMYLAGVTETFSSGSTLDTIERVNNFTSGSPTLAWTIVTQAPDVNPLGFLLYYGDFKYHSFDVENDKVFIAEQWGPIHVYDAVTGQPIGLLQSGPEVEGTMAWEDCVMGMHAYYNAAANEYDVTTENSGDSGRQNLYRWSPFSGSPSQASYTITGATNASPIVITTSANNKLATGNTVVIDGVLGNTAANGTFTVTKVSTTKFDLNGSTGNGTYTSGTGIVEYGGVPGDVDFDSPGVAGSAYQSSGTYTVNGGGAGYGQSGGDDQVNLCYALMDGNGSISAQVTGLSGSTAASASAAVTIRDGISTNGSQANCTLAVTESNGLVFQFKPAASGATTTVATVAGITPSSGEYVMLVRSTSKSAGDTVGAYYSSNGVSWTQVGSSVNSSGTGYKIANGLVTFTSAMHPTAYAGLAVTSANNSVLATGTFDRVLNDKVVVSVPPAPSGLAAVSGDGGVQLTWTTQSSAAQYDVYRGTSSGGETLLASDVAEPYLDTTATNGATYYYEVTAVGTGGPSGKSNETSLVYENWNPSFEWPVTFNQGGGYWSLDPTGIDWTCATSDSYGPDGYIGIAINGSGWTSLPAENGSQFAVILDYGELSQTLSGFRSSTAYTCTFYLAQSTFNNNTGGGPQSIEVTVDGSPVSLTQVGVGSVSNPVQPPSQTAWTEYSFNYTTGSSDPGSHTLAFLGADPGAVNPSVALLDNITITPGL